LLPGVFVAKQGPCLFGPLAAGVDRLERGRVHSIRL
jgi:hypothetical protein